jgi:hypothetical protein
MICQKQHHFHKSPSTAVPARTEHARGDAFGGERIIMSRQLSLVAFPRAQEPVSITASTSGTLEKKLQWTLKRVHAQPWDTSPLFSRLPPSTASGSTILTSERRYETVKNGLEKKRTWL